QRDPVLGPARPTERGPDRRSFRGRRHRGHRPRPPLARRLVRRIRDAKDDELHRAGRSGARCLVQGPRRERVRPARGSDSGSRLVPPPASIIRRVARRWTIVVALGSVVLGAAALRFWDLGNNPGGLYTDEAFEALSAHRILTDPGFHPVFFTDGGGREALFAYLAAGVFRFAGETTLALRATSAGIGVAGVLGIWLLGRRFSEGTGLVAAAWAAGSLWLICISRDGMRNILVPVLGALALVALLAWADRPTRIRASIAGAVSALAALYT